MDRATCDKICIKRVMPAEPRFREDFQSYSVTLKYGGVFHEAKVFSVSKYGSKEAAFNAACDFRDEEVALRYIPVRYSTLPMMDCAFPIPEKKENIERYFSGLIDGDGCICSSFEVRGIQNVSVTLSQAQTDGIPDVLIFCKHLFGGHLYTTQKTSKPNSRKLHSWMVKNEDAIPVLKILNKHIILKHRQVVLALQILMNGMPNRPIHDELKKSKDIQNYQSIKIEASKINYPYLSGFFDAEGCAVLRRDSITAIFAQKSSPALLNSIRNFLDERGSVEVRSRNCTLTLRGEPAIKLMQNIFTWSIVKRSQIEALFIIYDLKCRNPRRHKKYWSETDLWIWQNALEFLKSEKRK